MGRKAVLGGVLGIVLVSALGYSAWRAVAARDQQVCRVCQRPIHAHTKTVALVGGKRMSFCCPACALSAHEQSGQPVQVTSLTDYSTGQTLDPGRTFLVRNSDVNPCAGHAAHLGSGGQPMQSEFDRCSPSLLAFVSREEAQAFTREHGGQILRFADLASAYR